MSAAITSGGMPSRIIGSISKRWKSGTSASAILRAGLGIDPDEL